MMRIEQERKIPSPPKNDTISFLIQIDLLIMTNEMEKKIKNSATFR